MKQCPLCRHTYQEENATHCITDGTPLVQAFDTGGDSQIAPTMWSSSPPPNSSSQPPPKAVNNSFNNLPPFQAEPQFFIPPAASNPPKSSNSKLLIILGAVGVTVVLIIGILGIVGIVVYNHRPESSVSYTNPNPPNSNPAVVKTQPSFNPYSGVLKDIIPSRVGIYSMWKDIEPYTLTSPGKKEEVNAFYETPDKVRAALSVRNFVSAEEANKNLLITTKASIDVWKPTEKGNAAQVIKGGNVVGTMVTIYATDPYGAPTDIISWTNGSLLSQVTIRKRGEGKTFVDSMPF